MTARSMILVVWAERRSCAATDQRDKNRVFENGITYLFEVQSNFEYFTPFEIGGNGNDTIAIQQRNDVRDRCIRRELHPRTRL